jgi:REP element-mobilizing transposase RayT
LRYSWTGWLTAETTNLPPAELLDAIKPHWEQDGLRLLEHSWSTERIQLTFSTMPAVSPLLLAARAKGRLQHAFRQAQRSDVQFSRKLSVRSVGENTRQQVEDYIRSQVDNERYVDPRFREAMQEFTICRPDVDLSRPTESARGRYWYNLHVVLVAADRNAPAFLPRLSRLRDGCLRIAEKKRYCVSALSVMPDHIHMALRGNIEQAPEEAALAFLNNLTYLLTERASWSSNYYVGTFSEYDMGAIRSNRGVEE